MRPLDGHRGPGVAPTRAPYVGLLVAGVIWKKTPPLIPCQTVLRGHWWFSWARNHSPVSFFVVTRV